MGRARYIIFFAMLAGVITFWAYAQLPERMSWPWVLVSGPCVFVRATQDPFYVGDAWHAIRWSVPFFLLFVAAAVVALDKRLPVAARLLLAGGALATWVSAGLFWLALMI